MTPYPTDSPRVAIAAAPPVVCETFADGTVCIADATRDGAWVAGDGVEVDP